MRGQLSAPFWVLLTAQDVQKIVDKVASYTDVLHNSSYARYGPLYFFGSLAGLSNMVPPSEASGGGVFVAPTGTPWSSNRVCLVDTCGA